MDLPSESILFSLLLQGATDPLDYSISTIGGRFQLEYFEVETGSIVDLGLYNGWSDAEDMRDKIIEHLQK